MIAELIENIVSIESHIFKLLQPTFDGIVGDLLHLCIAQEIASCDDGFFQHFQVLVKVTDEADLFYRKLEQILQQDVDGGTDGSSDDSFSHCFADYSLLILDREREREERDLWRVRTVMTLVRDISP